MSTDTRGYRVFEFINGRIKAVTIYTVLVALVLVIVGGFVADRGEPDFAPGGVIYDIDDRVIDVFSTSSSLRQVSFLVEDPDGRDVLTRDGLLAFQRRVNAARADSTNQEHFATKFDSDIQVNIESIFSIADAVDGFLPNGLEGATNGDVKRALEVLLTDSAPTTGLQFGLSQLTRRDPTAGKATLVLWESPAFLATVIYDVSTFPGELMESFGEDTNLDAERWLRDLQVQLRGDQQDAEVIGVAIDSGLTGEEINQTSGPFIFAAVAFILLLVGALLRSYWAAMVAAAGLGVVMMSYNGVNSLIGLKTGSPLLLLIVPIALISFGIDFFIHGTGRAREYQVEGVSRERAYPLGATALFTALLLAVLSSIAAFLSNAASGIQAIIEFGIAAAIALALSYIVLGLIAPKTLLAVEESLGPRPDLHRSFTVGARLVAKKLGFVVACFVAGMAITMTIIMPGAVDAGGIIGAVVYLVFVGLFLVLPFFRARRRNRRAAAKGLPVSDEVKGAGHGFKAAGSIVHFLARWRVVTLPVVLILAVAGVAAAFQVESKFELTDFFSSRSDLIKSIDRLDVHFASQSGAPAYIYVEGDLSDPSALSALETAQAQIGASDAAFGRDFNGDLVTGQNAASIVRLASSSSAVQAAVGGDFADGNGDGFPDDPATIRAIYDHARSNGIVDDSGVTLLSQEQVESVLYVSGDTQATRIDVIVTSFTDDALILEARSVLDAAVPGLQSSIGTVETIGASGGAILQQDTLDSFTKAMVVSLPIALGLTFILVGLMLRSLRYALTALIPIMLVVAWVYGFMYVADYHINVITATIAAIAIGVGIDFSTHFTVRFLEEFKGEPSRFPAIRRAGEGTGGALAVSAATSITGFAVMSAAPSPMFATFGVLTVVMIAFALLVSLLVLPSLLVLATPGRKGEEREVMEAQVTGGKFDYDPHARSTAQREETTDE